MLGMGRYEPTRRRILREARFPNLFKLLGVYLLILGWVVGLVVLGHLGFFGEKKSSAK